MGARILLVIICVQGQRGTGTTSPAHYAEGYRIGANDAERVQQIDLIAITNSAA
jgi:hypothetical protein